MRFFGVLFAMTIPAQSAPSTQNALRSDEFAVHRMLYLGRFARDGNKHISSETELPFALNELIPSWNLNVPSGMAYRVEVRVGRTRGVDARNPKPRADVDTAGQPTEPVEWSAWYCFAGSKPLPGEAAHAPVIKDVFGTVNTDYLTLDRACNMVQVRVTASRGEADAKNRHDAEPAFGISRFALCISNTLGDKRLWEAMRRKPKRVDPSLYMRRLDVPFQSQHVREPGMEGNICSPTSVAMVLGYRGVQRTQVEVARAAFDPENRIYGNWPRNVQAAFEAGVEGYVTRFADWDGVQAMIAEGQPIIASIRDPEGQLKGTPYKSTTGHLLVICGFDNNGNVLVNDPAGRNAEHGQLSYDRAQFERAWLRNGGVAYILEAPPTPARPVPARR